MKLLQEELNTLHYAVPTNGSFDALHESGRFFLEQLDQLGQLLQGLQGPFEFSRPAVGPRTGSQTLGLRIADYLPRSGFRDRFNKGRGLTVVFGHRKGVVTWAQIADYVRPPAPLARSSVPAQQLALFG